jgi:hypothetical protein
MDDFCLIFTPNQIKSAVNIRTTITTSVTVSSSHPSLVFYANIYNISFLFCGLIRSL